MLAARMFILACTALLAAVVYAIVGLHYSPEPVRPAKFPWEEEVWPVELQKVDPQVLAAFRHRRTAYVQVEVTLQPVHEGKIDPRARRAAVKAIQDRVLSKLSRKEFRLTLRAKDCARLIGCVNVAGLMKLAQDCEVVAIGPSTLCHPLSTWRSESG
jgi:hypothetical protein